jgi:2-polyprenyl-3-methyl-5-hydroxy-6-metoxy-1,4-benzoquinol methylase
MPSIPHRVNVRDQFRDEKSMAPPKNACPICESQATRKWLDYDDRFQIDKCTSCASGFMVASESADMSYHDYGGYLTERDDAYFLDRQRMSTLKKFFFKLIDLKFGKDINILDFGGGAGFFAKSCVNAGFKNAHLVEPSEKFRDTALKRLKLSPNLIGQNLDDFGNLKFDLVVMLDVIEHLPVNELHQILDRLASRISSGGFLIGVTPNVSSLNIKLHGARDPVIAPPSHTLYFQRKALDKLLRRHGLKRRFLFTSGLSTNSFFRPHKSRPSWVELPSSKQKVPAALVRLLFKLLNFPLILLNIGYHVYFIYQKPSSDQSQ